MLTNNQWFDAICKSYSKPPVTIGDRTLPGFPSDTLQQNTTGQAGVDTLRPAFIFYEDCIRIFEELQQPIQPHHQLLDFGTGWGRIARFFLRELPQENIHGLDVTPEFVEICRATFSSNNFYTTPPFPPTTLPSGKFNYIVGYSVFSHLSEAACLQWMEEFHRILAPNGLVVLTTRGKSFFDFCESLKGQGYTGYLGALSGLFENFAAARAAYDRGDFVHSNNAGVSGGGAMNSEFYGETFIPELYARAAYSEMFTLEKFLFEDDAPPRPPRQEHPALFFRKK